MKYIRSYFYFKTQLILIIFIAGLEKKKLEKYYKERADHEYLIPKRLFIDRFPLSDHSKL